MNASMQPAYKQVLAIRSRDSVRRVLSLLATACLDEAGAGQLIECATLLEQASVDCRMVAQSVRDDIWKARDYARCGDGLRILSALPELSAADRAEILRDVESRLRGVAHLKKRVVEDSLASQPCAVVAPQAVASSHPPEPPQDHQRASRAPLRLKFDVAPVGRPRTKSRPKMSREKGLRLFEELDRELGLRP